MFDINNIMGKVKEAQEAMQKAQENLSSITVQAESGAGMVQVTIYGNRQVIELNIDPDIISKEDKVLIQDLTIAAINKALAEIEIKIKDEMQKSTEGLMPNIPGFNMGNFS